MAEELDRSKYTFYLNADGIFNSTKDKKMLKDFVNAFKKAGFKAKIVGYSQSNIHTKPDKYGCTGANDVWCMVFGGDDAALYKDTIAGKWFKNKLGKAHVCVIRVFNSGGISKKAKNINNLKKAHDDNYSKYKDGSVVIKGNFAEFLTKIGLSWFEGTPATIVKQIKEGKIEGVGFTFLTNSNIKSDVKIETEKIEQQKGYSTSKPFMGYFQIEYTVNHPYGHVSNPPVKIINVDFSLQAPEATNPNVINGKKLYPSFNNTVSSWVNDKPRENTFNLLQHIKDAEDDFGEVDKLYYLHKVSFKAEFKDNYQDVTTNDKETQGKSVTTTNVLYESTDEASYKMNIYSLGFYKGDIVTAKNMNSSGKKVNSVLEDVLKDTNCYTKMNYGLYRFNDSIKFVEIKENITMPVFDFYEDEHWDLLNSNKIVDGNIVGLSNVSYSPINDTLNNSLFIFKGRYDILREEPTMSYYYQRYCDLNNVLKYGEQTLLNSDTSNNSSNTEAYIAAKKNYYNNYDERRSYTIDVIGIPPVYINDFVRTHMDNPNLDSGESGLRVASIEYKIDPKERPVIQTTLGLGKPDKKFVIENKRKNTQDRMKELNIGENINYYSKSNDINLGGLI